MPYVVTKKTLGPSQFGLLEVFVRKTRERLAGWPHPRTVFKWQEGFWQKMKKGFRRRVQGAML